MRVSTFMIRWLLTVVGLLVLAMLPGAMLPGSVRAADKCSADWTLLGEFGSPPIQWFNVFGAGFEVAPIQVTTDVPVITYNVDDPYTILPAATTSDIPVEYINSDYFKWTLGAPIDATFKTVSVTMVGQNCEASTVVNLDPNAPSTPNATLPPTSTIEAANAPGQLPAVPVGLAIAAFVGVFLARRIPKRN